MVEEVGSPGVGTGRRIRRMAEGAGACQEGAELGAGTAEWLAVPLGSVKVWFHARTTGRSEPCPRTGTGTLGLRGSRKVGASHAGARVSRDPPGATPVGPQPGFGRGSPIAHARPSGRVSRGGSERVDIASCVEDSFQSFSQGKKAFGRVAFA